MSCSWGNERERETDGEKEDFHYTSRESPEGLITAVIIIKVLLHPLSC